MSVSVEEEGRKRDGEVEVAHSRDEVEEVSVVTTTSPSGLVSVTGGDGEDGL